MVWILIKFKLFFEFLRVVERLFIFMEGCNVLCIVDLYFVDKRVVRIGLFLEIYFGK